MSGSVMDQHEKQTGISRFRLLAATSCHVIVDYSSSRISCLICVIEENNHNQ
jgi:hypothetical protein